ncbi:pentaheme c-type cytochrome TorC [Sansalvadorimonas sp. 2012CJ34-2]|uniref:Cytochrome c-type protein n=1 Tax=Parendozoicomonas callyspongiae TaxID=2942213 RepID=A0ABT0PHF1_9GAMM|nr:pentaheme c-type cytochrome TorC [Sansalvadorimonas sp. 2012CJ34-2]MCL6269923.1 pentaheme c-type cytochrome TorC [Sansalvadorimonas sp. 2012CJ34-2]
MKNAWRFLTSPTGRYSVLALVVVGIIIGVALVFTGHKTMELTGTTEFCTSCHTMKQPLEEYKQSIHFTNASGVRAECVDCHMPQDFAGQMERKLQAANDVYEQYIGKSIDTPELYEEQRLHMAQTVWARMEENDSSGCRSCHSYEAMDHSKQPVQAAKQMLEAAKSDQTCISCHKGVAHKMPDMSGGYRKSFKKLEKLAAKPADAEILYALTEMPLFKTESAKKEAGKLLPATEVKVLESKGDMLKVEVQGWKEKSGRGRVLTQEAGKRIFAATLKGSFSRKVEVLETTQIGDKNKEWQKVSSKAWIRNENLLPELKPIWDYTDELYKASCSECHGAPDINHFSSTEWIAQLKGMMGFVDLDKREERTLLKYLQTHASDSANGSQNH